MLVRLASHAIDRRAAPVLVFTQADNRWREIAAFYKPARFVARSERVHAALIYIKMTDLRHCKVLKRRIATPVRNRKKNLMNVENHGTQTEPASFSTMQASAWKCAALMVAVILAFYVLREHWGHVFGLLPYLILLACPLMHLFMHHGDQHGPGHNHPAADDRRMQQ